MTYTPSLPSRISKCCGVIIFIDEWDSDKPKCAKCKSVCYKDAERDFKTEASGESEESYTFDGNDISEIVE